MKPERGFTLVEVMVALAIVALALTAMASSMNTMIDNASTMRERTYASWIAQNKIAELRLAGVLPEVGTNSGELEYGGTQWSWRATISETGVESFMRIDVSVSLYDSDYDIRTVTGFVGLPPGRNVANSVWQPAQGGGRGDGATE
jgi:general secretion pathway protein I